MTFNRSELVTVGARAAFDADCVQIQLPLGSRQHFWEENRATYEAAYSHTLLAVVLAVTAEIRTQVRADQFAFCDASASSLEEVLQGIESKVALS